MLTIENTALAVIDVQGRLAAAVHEHEHVLVNIQHCIKVSQSFHLPVIWTEQAPNKIGGTVSSIKDLLYPVSKPIPKRSFSCWEVADYRQMLKATGRKQILMTGIETHVCVYQTARDLHRHGYEVHVVADAVSSRYEIDKKLALARLRDEGVTITSAEMAICELLKSADHPKFKEIVAFLKR